MVGETKSLSRRRLVSVGGLTTLGLLAACAPAAQPAPAAGPQPTAVPKPTIVAKPAPAVAQPTVAPTAKPAPSPAARSFTPAAVTLMNTQTAKAKSLAELTETLGYYKQFGLTATTTGVPDVSRVVAALVAGSADVGVNVGFGPVFPAVAKGVGLKILAGATMKPQYLVYTNDPAIKTLKDLEGKSVGSSPPGALTHALLMAMFKKHGVDPGKVTFVTIGGSTDVYRAIVAKKVDGGAAEVDFQRRMAEDGLTSIAEAWTELPGYVSTGIITSDQAIAEKRDVLVRTLAAWGQIFRFLRKPESKGPYVATMKNQGASEDEAVFSWQWHVDHQGYDYDLVLAPEQITFFQQVNLDAGGQEVLVPVEKVADMSLARDALKLMTVS